MTLYFADILFIFFENRKDFKSESQLEQHFSSKNHKKKVSESRGKKGLKQANDGVSDSVELPDDRKLSKSEAAIGGMSKKALKKKNKKMQVFAPVAAADLEEISSTGDEDVDKFDPTSEAVMARVIVEESDSHDSDSDDL